MKNLIRKIIPKFFISWYHLKLAFWGAVFYGFPSRKLKVIGITGTNGKSTVVYLTTKILEQAALQQAQGKDFKVASISSIKFKIGEKEWQNDLKMTMPGRFKLQKFLGQAVKAECQYAVLEITSEGIKQHRHKYINFDTAVFTNLTPEHIEAHGSFEKYKKAKAKLFKKTNNIHIVNLDDENSEYFLQFPANKKIKYALQSRADLTAKDIRLFPTGSSFKIDNIEFNLNLLGEFNIYNFLAAICVGLSQGVNLETCKRALEKITGIPGRMEIVIRGQTGVRPGSDPTVIVDYAHTPDSLRKVYQTLTTSYQLPTTKLICVLGAAGGGRDKWKRAELGKIASQYCDQIILTNEDPYCENQNQILSEIEAGISNIQYPRPTSPARQQLRSFGRAGGRAISPPDFACERTRGRAGNIQKILDRRMAIKKSLELAKAGDVVIITGKGCEPWMCVEKNKKVPWDDRRIVREEFNKL